MDSRSRLREYGGVHSLPCRALFLATLLWASHVGAESPQIAVHRAGGRGVTENTIPAALAALARGAHIAEIDVRTTEDGVLVVAHDDRPRQCRKVRSLAHTSFSRLTAICGSGVDARVPALRDFFAALPRNAEVMLDPKAVSIPALIALARDSGFLDRVFLYVELVSELDGVLAAFSDTVRILARARGPADHEQLATHPDTRVSWIHAEPRWLDADLVRRAHAAGKRVWLNDFGGGRCGPFAAMGLDVIQTENLARCQRALSPIP